MRLAESARNCSHWLTAPLCICYCALGIRAYAVVHWAPADECSVAGNKLYQAPNQGCARSKTMKLPSCL
eukprot:7547119-Alexandrium_andersonii.AAC.1